MWSLNILSRTSSHSHKDVKRFTKKNHSEPRNYSQIKQTNSSSGSMQIHRTLLRSRGDRWLIERFECKKAILFSFAARCKCRVPSRALSREPRENKKRRPKRRLANFDRSCIPCLDKPAQAVEGLVDLPLESSVAVITSKLYSHLESVQLRHGISVRSITAVPGLP